MMAALGCPGEETIVAFAEGHLAPGAIAHIQSHAVACSICQDLLAAAVKGRTGAQTQSSLDHDQSPDGAAPPLTRGSRVGRYTVLALVGRGGMGEVYAAYDARLDRKVALKLLHAGRSFDREHAQARLLREAKAMAKVSHPNVVAVHDTGQFEGRVYIAMEYLDGGTLADWLAKRASSRDEILAAFIAAARGLAAAHAAGLVHRDFKPGNVMLSRSGSVRVTDFGLARSLADFDDEDPRDGAARTSDPHLTRTGARLGTPLFMAPEQFMARPIDARTDQFSFCVALYGALYGAAPFRTNTIEALTANVLAGRVEPAPPDSAVPAWLRRVVLRGLSVDPAARWPSMADLVTALQAEPSRRWRRRAGVATVLAVAGLSVVALVRGGARTEPLCTGGPAHLAAVWESPDSSSALPTRRGTVEKAFLTSGVPSAPEIWSRVEGVLDRYRADWLSMYRDVCEATQVRHEQSMALLDLRMSCLEDRRLAFSALTSVLMTSDQDAVRKASEAAAALPPLSRCADRAQLESTSELPRDEVTRRRVHDLRERMATTKALLDTGKYQKTRERALSQLAEARSVGYRPLVAEALTGFGRSSWTDDHPTDLPMLEEAVWTSLAVGRDDLAAEAAALTSMTDFHFERNDECRTWLKAANAIIDRLGGEQPRLRALMLLTEGETLLENDPAAALDRFQRIVTINENVLAPNDAYIIAALNNAVMALLRLGRNEEALHTEERAYDLYLRTYGSASLEVATTLTNMGEVLIALGRPSEALEPLRRSYGLLKDKWGWTDKRGRLDEPLKDIGLALLALGKATEAVPVLEHALRIRADRMTDASGVTESRFALARALSDAHVDRARARALAKKARDGYAGASDEKHTAEIDRWLADHGDPQLARRSRASAMGSVK
jgi:serine/threonine-protein kinase